MKGLKVYVVRKYVLAKSAKDAIKKQSRCEIDDVFIDHDATKQLDCIDNDNKENNLGFTKE